MKRRVAITGLGVVAPGGSGAAAFLSGLRGSRSFIGPLTRFDPGELSTKIAGEVSEVGTRFHPDPAGPDAPDLGAQFALEAAREAWRDSGLPETPDAPDRAAVVLGVTAGGMEYFDRYYRGFLDGSWLGDRRVYPGLLSGSAPAILASALGLEGPCLSVSTGCAAGTDAVGLAFGILRRGDADVAVCGGADAPLTPLCFSAFTANRAMSTRNDAPALASRPFDRDRDGFVMSEGAGILVLEDLDRARRRGARVYAELTGYGTTLNAYHMTAPLPDGSADAEAMRLAMRDGAVNADEVGYVNAHGSSTPLNGLAETAAIRKAFGTHADRLAVSSIKGAFGHPFGGAGGQQAAACALSLHHGFLPPTVNHEIAGDGCDLDYVPREARETRVEASLLNTCGFSGKNAVLAFRRWKGE